MPNLTYVKLSIATAALITAVSFTAPALAVEEHNVVPGLTAVGAPLGLHGIDPVAFIEIGNRIAGTATYTEKHDGVAYVHTVNSHDQRKASSALTAAFGQNPYSLKTSVDNEQLNNIDSLIRGMSHALSF